MSTFETLCRCDMSGEFEIKAYTTYCSAGIYIYITLAQAVACEVFERAVEGQNFTIYT